MLGLASRHVARGGGVLAPPLPAGVRSSTAVQNCGELLGARLREAKTSSYLLPHTETRLSPYGLQYC